MPAVRRSPLGEKVPYQHVVRPEGERLVLAEQVMESHLAYAGPLSTRGEIVLDAAEVAWLITALRVIVREPAKWHRERALTRPGIMRKRLRLEDDRRYSAFITLTEDRLIRSNGDRSWDVLSAVDMTEQETQWALSALEVWQAERRREAREAAACL